MKPVAVAQAVADFGLEGDRHAKAGSRRQVLLVEKETLDALDLPPGIVRENITTQGANLMSLVPGRRLRCAGPSDTVDSTFAPHRQSRPALAASR